MPDLLIEELPYIYDINMNVDGNKVNYKTHLHYEGMILKEMRKGFSPAILICGRQRIGKSFVGNMIGYRLMKAMGKVSNFDPVKDSFYEPKKMIESLENANTEIRIVDEAGSLLGRREWYDQTHRALEKIIQTQGYKCMLYIFISPFASDIDKIFLKHFDLIIKVTTRGKFKVFKTIKRYDELNKYVIKRYFIEYVKYNLKDLPKHIWKRYEEHSMKEKERLRVIYSEMRKSSKSSKTFKDRLKDRIGDA